MKKKKILAWNSVLEFSNKNREESWNIAKKIYSGNLNILETAFVKKIRICDYIVTVTPNYIPLKCEEVMKNVKNVCISEESI